MGADEREEALRMDLEETAAALHDAQAALELRTAFVKDFDAQVMDSYGVVRQLEKLKLNMEEKLASSSDQIEEIKVGANVYPSSSPLSGEFGSQREPLNGVCRESSSISLTNVLRNKRVLPLPDRKRHADTA